MDEIVFRSATPDDAVEIADFMTRNFLAAYGHSSNPENIRQAIHDYYGVQAQQADLADDRIINCLCIMDDKIAGLAQIKPPRSDADANKYELSRFYVDAKYHGMGIAPAMMEKILAWLVGTFPARSIWLSVWQGAPQAIRFYQKQGFAISGETIFMIGNDPMKDWLMTRDLQP